MLLGFNTSGKEGTIVQLNKAEFSKEKICSADMNGSSRAGRAHRIGPGIEAASI